MRLHFQLSINANFDFPPPLSVLSSISIQNILKAQKEIDRLEAEAQDHQPFSSGGPSSSSSRGNRAHDSAKKPTIANQAVSGPVSAEAELVQEKDAAADVSKELKEEAQLDGDTVAAEE